MRKLTGNEHSILEFFFSNAGKNVFVLLNMPEVLKGALFSRYSRSSKGLRQLFLEEYLTGELALSLRIKPLRNLKAAQEMLGTGKARDFYSRWLSLYGDDSIAELGGAHLGIENISVVAAKAIEERRIGLSPLEKSTRYVRFDNKINGKYLYYRDPEILKSRSAALYVGTMDNLFRTYSSLTEPMMEYFHRKFPRPEGVSEKAYATSIRAKACDTLRGLLPMGLLTNMGVFGNGRAFEYLLTKMAASELPEVRNLGKKMNRELSLVIGSFLERLETEKGENYVNYLRQTENEGENLAKKYASSKTAREGRSSVTFLENDPKAPIKAATAILYPKSNQSWSCLYESVRKLPESEIEKIIEAYVGARQGRWHKVGRAFEEIYYSFEIVSDLGVYKDLQRHRILTNFRQKFTTEHGYEVPVDVTEAGFAKHYQKALDTADKAYQKVKKTFPSQVEYLACHGHLGRWKIKLNLREAFHLCELRSSPQGHPAYRKVAQEIYQRIKAVDPILGKAMKFVDLSNPGLERLSSEIRKEEKLKALSQDGEKRVAEVRW